MIYQFHDLLNTSLLAGFCNLAQLYIAKPDYCVLQEAAGGCRLGLGHTGGQRGVPNTMAIQAGGGRHPLVDFCTLRRPASNNRPPPRSVQFADQQNVSNSTDLLMLL